MFVRLDVVEQVVVGLGLVLCVSMSGCKKEGTTSPGADQAGEAQAPGDSGDPVAELAALEGRMRALGLPVAADKVATEKAATDMSATEEAEDDGMGDAASGGAHGDALPAEEAPAPTAAQVGVAPPARDEQNYCGDLCSLSESICTLEVRICSLAESHANDSTYADACERAIEDCEVAGEACDGCG